MSLYDYPIDPPNVNSTPEGYEIEFLSFAGAGVNGLAYVGVMKSLEEREIRQKVKYWIGTSAGAIVAGLGSLGADSQFIFKCLSETNLNEFIDYGGKNQSGSWWTKLRSYYSATELFSKLGLARGDQFNIWLRKTIQELGFPEDITFAQLYDRTGNRLVTVAACLNTCDAICLTRSTFPHMTVADAIHVSMIIPYIFQPVVMKDPLDCNEGRILLDGGILNNYPINVCDPQTPSGRLLGINRKAVGFFTISNGLWGPNREVIDNFLKFSRTIISAMFRQQERNQSHQPYFWDRSVAIDTFGHSAVNFEINQDWKERLVESGYKSTEIFLEKRRAQIAEKGLFPGNLFIPVIHHQIPLDADPSKGEWLKLPNWPAWIYPLSNDNLRDTLIYQTNSECRKERNVVGH